MNWHQSPELLDRLAAEYSLGTLAGGARRRFEAVMKLHPPVARAVARWDTRLEPMGAQLPELDAGEALWSRIEQRVGGESAGGRSGGRTVVRTVVNTPSTWWQRLLSPIPAGALAFGLMLGIGAPTIWQVLQADGNETQLPQSYVGVLSTAEGKQGLVVSSLRRGKTVDFKTVQVVAVPPGSQLFLWTLDAKGVAQPVGVLPALVSSAGGMVSLRLERTAEEVFARAVELAVTVEISGAQPAQPTFPYVYRGQCGKLWRVPPPK